MPFNGGHCPEFIGYVFVPGMTPRADNSFLIILKIATYLFCVRIRSINKSVISRSIVDIGLQ